MPLAVASVAIMTTVGVAMIVMGTGIVMVNATLTGTTDGMTGVRREEVSNKSINTMFGQRYLLTHHLM